MLGDLSLLATTIGAPFLAAALIGAAGALGRGAGSLPAALGLGAMGAVALLVAVGWATLPRPFLAQTTWAEALGIRVGVYVDDLSLLFAALVAGVGLLTMLYSIGYVPRELGRPGGRDLGTAYYGYLLVAVGAMLGMIFSVDLVQLYVFWDLIDVAAFLLIGLNWRDPAARHAAVKALAITTLGGVALLVSFVLLGSAAGTLSIPTLLEREGEIRSSPMFGTALVLLVIGAAAKSTQFPFHTWLPNAMVAATPVNALLDSAAVVAAGVYVLARFQPIFDGEALWSWLVTGVGLASMIGGGILALKARDLKVILAYSTISQHGFIFALLGYGGSAALFASLFFLLQHALLKAALFFAVGALMCATGVTQVSRATTSWSRGLWTRLPMLALVTVALALSLGGIPPLAGFWMKEEFLAETLETGLPLLVGAAVAASALTIVYMGRFLAGSFVGHTAASTRVGALPPTLLVPPALVALLTVLFGLAPQLAAEGLVAPAVRAVTGEDPHIEFAIHLDATLLLSMLALFAGAVAFAARQRWIFVIDELARPTWSVDRLFAAVMSGAERAGLLALRLQNGALPRYVSLTLLGYVGLITFAAVALLPTLPMPHLSEGSSLVRRGLLDGAMVLLLLLVAAGSVLTLTLRQHLHVVLALGAVGYFIAGVFAVSLAPNLGLVQVHVETLVTILLVIVLIRVPRRIRQELVLGARERLGRWRLIAAVGAGATSTWLSWLAIEHAPAEAIGPWFNEHAPELTHADDVVAAILVHFRALDTLGEIIVFAIATAGVYALVRLMRRETE